MVLCIFRETKIKKGGSKKCVKNVVATATIRTVNKIEYVYIIIIIAYTCVYFFTGIIYFFKMTRLISLVRYRSTFQCCQLVGLYL